MVQTMQVRAHDTGFGTLRLPEPVNLADTGPAASKYSADSPASTTSPPYRPRRHFGNAVHHPNRISGPHRVRNTAGRFAKNQFSLDFDAGQLTCPAGIAMPFEPGRPCPPKDTCAACPLRQRCTASSHGRSVSIHPDEAPLAELRHRQATPAGRARRGTRRGRARPRAHRTLARPPRPLPGHPQEPVRPAPRRRRPQSPRHRPPATSGGLPASGLTT